MSPRVGAKPADASRIAARSRADHAACSITPGNTDGTSLKEVEALTPITVKRELRVVGGRLKTDDTDLEDLVIETPATLVSRELKTHRVKGDCTQDGAFEASTSTVEFAGTRKQQIRGASTALEFHSLRVNKTGSEVEATRLETSKRIRVGDRLDVERGRFEPATESQFRHVSLRNDSTLRPRLTATGAPGELEVTGNVRKERLARFDRNGSRLRLRGTTRQEVELFGPTELEIDPSRAHSVRFSKQYSENALAESPVTLVNSLSTLSTLMRLLHGNLVTMSNRSVILDVVNGPVETTVGFDGTPIPSGYAATMDWGDSTTTNGVFDSVAGVFEFSHAYVEAGVYTLTATLTDGTNEAIVRTHAFLVVYDPDGGFVTGGGWIESPPTACKDTDVCVDTTGEAHFGFVSKYKRGASVPSGVTQFQFKAGDSRRST